jgi:hypothetical protein
VADRLNCRKYLVLGVLKTGGSSELKKKRFRVPENFDFSSFIILRGGLCDISFHAGQLPAIPSTRVLVKLELHSPNYARWTARQSFWHKT